LLKRKESITELREMLNEKKRLKLATKMKYFSSVNTNKRAKSDSLISLVFMIIAHWLRTKIIREHKRGLKEKNALRSF